MTDILMFLLLSAGLLANVAWTVFLFRKSRQARVALSGDAQDIDAKVERILSEIHRVTSANVELLESRIDALREVGVLADERLRRLRASLTDLEVLLGRVQRVKKTLADAPSPDPETSIPVIPPPASDIRVSKAEAVESLQRRGLSERQIAEKMSLGIAEIRFLMKMAEKVETR